MGGLAPAAQSRWPWFLPVSENLVYYQPSVRRGAWKVKQRIWHQYRSIELVGIRRLKIFIPFDVIILFLGNHPGDGCESEVIIFINKII